MDETPNFGYMATWCPWSTIAQVYTLSTSTTITTPTATVPAEVGYNKKKIWHWFI